MLQAITQLVEHEPAHRTKILKQLLERGIMGNEKNPMRQLAAFLSVHRDRFVSDGKGNFSLRRDPAPQANGLFESDTGRPLSEPASHEIGA